MINSMNRRHVLAMAPLMLTAYAAPGALHAKTPDSERVSNWMTRSAGAKVHSFSSEFGAGWVADNLVPTSEQLQSDGRPVQDLIWSSGQSAPFPHWVIIDLGQTRWLTQFVFNNALSEEADHPGISARQLTVWMGSTVQTLKKVAGFELERNKDGQAVSIEPVQGRYVKFLISANWGHPWYTELGTSMALDDGRRPGDLAQTLKTAGKADLYGIYFDFNSATLRPESATTLAQILAFHRANPQQKLIIEGHTDNVGSDRVNAELSSKRAAAVVAELVRQGASARMFQPQGRGASQPIAPNADEAGRARNRRVTVVLA